MDRINELEKDEWEKILQDYNYEDCQKIYERIKNKSQKSSEDFDIINQIVLWKLNRSVDIKSDIIEDIYNIKNRIEKPEEVINDKKISELIDDLIECKGIRLPMATTILHFYYPELFPIIDKRASRTLDMTLTDSSDPDFYFEYLSKCFKLSKKYGIPLEKVDKVLYNIDKVKRGNKL